MNAHERHECLDRARRGDTAALGALLESYSPYIRVLVRSLSTSRLQARLDESDLIQDAVLEAHRQFGRFRGSTPAELTAWLRQVVLRTVGHVLREHLGTAARDATRDQPLVAQPVDPAPTPAEEAHRAERSARLAAALARLPNDMQEVLLARHLEDLPYKALAERTGRSEAALRVLYTRALRRLRQEFGDETA
jgi:RNA polymerase sigma-70 factor (ECF subfamily)